MEYKFDENVDAIRTTKSIYKKEYGLIQELLQSDHRTIKFYYEDYYMTRTAAIMIRSHINKNALPLIAVQRKNNVIVLKEC